MNSIVLVNIFKRNIEVYVRIPEFLIASNYNGNKTGVFVKHECLRRQQSPKFAILSIKVTAKVTRSLIFVLFERIAY